jgi:outer membrane immunogenic protein
MKNRLALAFVALCLTPAASPAADQPPAAPLYRPAPFIPRQAVEWTGLYFGVNAGYGWAQGSSTTVFTGSALNQQGFFTTTPQGAGATELSATQLLGSGNPNGAIAGGQIGFNWQAGRVVFGAEVDAQWLGQQTTFAVACTTGCTATENVKIKSLTTGRARVGWAFDWLMPYVTAGAALVNASDDLTVTVGGVTASFPGLSNATLGWTAGAGLEVALWSNWSARLEYLHVRINDLAASVAIPSALGQGLASEAAGYRENIVRVGLNYRFGPPGGPGVLEGPRAAPVGYASAYDFLPSAPMFADKATGVKRPPAATMVAEDVPQREAPIAAGRGTERAPAAATMVAGDVPQREAPMAAARGTERAGAAAANEPKVATPAIRNFADIEDNDNSATLAAVPGAITLPTLKQRPKADDDSRRLKRIMSICSSC